MREYYEDEQKYSWIVYAFCALIVGGLGGYILAIAGTRPGAGVPAQTAAAAPSTAPPTPLVDEGALKAYRDILTRDPKHLQAAVNAGNLLYDGHRYVEAIPFYQRRHRARRWQARLLRRGRGLGEAAGHDTRLHERGGRARAGGRCAAEIERG